MQITLSAEGLHKIGKLPLAKLMAFSNCKCLYTITVANKWYILKFSSVSLGPCSPRMLLTPRCLANRTQARSLPRPRAHRENVGLWERREWVVHKYECTSMKGHRPQVLGPTYMWRSARAQSDNNTYVSDVPSYTEKETACVREE